jgi:hypothetical protein
MNPFAYSVDWYDAVLPKEVLMDDDALAFLERWVEDNVRPIAVKLRAEQAEVLAAKCYQDAADADISEEALDEVAEEATDGGDLTAYMETALDKADDLATSEDED